MKKKSMISIAIVSVFLLSGLALAGIDPNPFRNQLGAVENILNSALNRIEKVMGVDPEPFEPGPNVNGAVNRLEAIDNQLVLANDMVVSIAEEVMGIDPTPFHPDIVIALENVSSAAQNIAEEVMGVDPTPFHPDIVIALEDVGSAAQSIVDTVEYYLELQQDCGTCAGLTPDQCGVRLDCSWVIPPGTDGYCCEYYNPDW